MTGFEILQSAIDDGPISLPVNSHKSLTINGQPLSYEAGLTLTVEHTPGVKTKLHVNGDGIKAHVFPLVNVYVTCIEITPDATFACGKKFGTPFREKINLSFGGAA